MAPTPRSAKGNQVQIRTSQWRQRLNFSSTKNTTPQASANPNSTTRETPPQDHHKTMEMEILFMQIFEKKNQIIELVRHQTLLFDQHLASKCVLDGIVPPSWLWSPPFPYTPDRYFKKGVNQALQEGVSRKLGHSDSSKRGQTNKAKVSNSITIGKYGMNRMSESVQGRSRPFSKPQVSGTPSLRKEGPSLGWRVAKRNSVVSNATVKALEAADVAMRKRQKEEEKKDKKPKRKHGMEPWKQQRENREKLRTKKEKELKCQPVPQEERAKDRKASRNGAGKDNKKETEMGDVNLRNLSKTEPNPTIFSTSDSIKASIVLEACEASTEYGDNSKVKRYLEKATVDSIFTNTYQEESYDISPYIDSDDEDEEENHIPTSKFIPPWASKSCLALALSHQQSLNPEVIFTPQRSCGIYEVFLLEDYIKNLHI